MDQITCKSCGTKYRTDSGICPKCGALNAAPIEDDFGEESEPSLRQRSEKPAPEPVSEQEEPQEEAYTWESILAEMEKKEQQREEEPPKEAEPTEKQPEPGGKHVTRKQRKMNGKAVKTVLILLLVAALIGGAVYAEKQLGILSTIRELMKPVEELPELPVTEEENTDCTKITISALEISLTEIGAKQQLSVTVEPENCPQKINWVSADPSIATVDQTGLVTAVAEGNVNILVTCGDYAATCRVTVAPEAPEEEQTEPEEPAEELPMELDLTDITMRYPGETAKLELLHSGDRTVTWSTDNDTILSVDADGVVTALGTGTAYVYAEADGQTFECIVRLRLGGEEGKMVPYRLSHTDITMFHAGEVLRLEIHAAEGAKLTNVGTWKSGDEKVCTVNEKGVITAVGKGTTEVTIEVDGVKLLCIVRVNIAEDNKE